MGKIFSNFMFLSLYLNVTIIRLKKIDKKIQIITENSFSHRHNEIELDSRYPLVNFYLNQIHTLTLL